MKKIIKYICLGILALLIGCISFSPKFRGAVTRVWYYYVIHEPAEYLNQCVSHDVQALELFDKQYITAQEKLSKLKALKLDAELSVQRTQERVDAYKRQGKDDLAMRNEQQIIFYKNQLEGYEKSIETRTNKLIELKTLREQAKEDVRLAKERINMLMATRDALSDDDQQAIIDRAQEHVFSLQSHSNKLTAEIAVLNMD